MRHVLIARLTFGITALFVAAAAIFAATRPEVTAVETTAPEQAVAQGQACGSAPDSDPDWRQRKAENH